MIEQAEANRVEDLVMSEEKYSIGYGDNITRRHMKRTAETRASFFIPHLRPGMRLLDCGCGPGSITVGLARIVAPGTVVGIDIEPKQIERARGRADAGTVSLHFQTGNIYDLPFPDASFDAAFAHNVLEHLSDPLKALKEMRRVLKPGGVIGVRDPYFGTAVIEPPLFKEKDALVLRVRELSGGSPYYARRQKQLFLDAGFVNIKAFAFVEYNEDDESTSDYAEAVAEVLNDPVTMTVAREEGLADERRLQEMIAEVLAWGRNPAAFRAVIDCAAVGWIKRDQ